MPFPSSAPASPTKGHIQQTPPASTPFCSVLLFGEPSSAAWARKWMKMQVFFTGKHLHLCMNLPCQVHRLFHLLYLIQFPEEHLCPILQVRKLRQKVIASPKVSMRTRTLTPGFWLQVREPSNKHVLTFIQMPGQFVYPDTQQ